MIHTLLRLPFRYSPFSGEETRQLFLLSALPINFWYILVWLRSFWAIVEESGLWEALGVGAYMLIFSLAEVVLIFFLVFYSSHLINAFPKLRRNQHRLSLVGMLYLVVAGILILEQSRHMFELPTDGPLWEFINRANNLVASSPIIILFIGLLVFAGFVIAVYRSTRIKGLIPATLDKLALLSSLYLSLNVISLIIVIYRNLFP